LAAQYQTAQGLAGEPLSRLAALGKMITSMLPQTQGTGITTEFGSIRGQDEAVDDLTALLKKWGIL